MDTPVSKTKEEILQECKDKVANKNGFLHWNDLQSTWFSRTGITPVVHESYVGEVADLYASQQCSLQQKEIERLKEALKELKRFLPSLKYIASKEYVYPDNCLQVLRSEERRVG